MKSKKKLLNLFVFLQCQSLCLKAKKKSIRQNICSNSPVLNRRLLFWEDSSHPPVSSWDLPLWDGPGLNARHLWIFQVNHIFCKLSMKTLARSNKIRCIRYLGHYLHHEQWVHANKRTYCLGTSERSTWNKFENQYSL